MPTQNHSKPQQLPKARVISRDVIRDQAVPVLKAQRTATSTELAKAIGADAPMVAVALSTDPRFVREVKQGVMRWCLASMKVTAAEPSPAPDRSEAIDDTTAVVVPMATAPRVVVEEIDGKRAAQLLRFSRGNRKLRNGHIEWLIRQINDGCWRLTPQAIAVSVSGRLLDGHHRLEAIARAQKTVIAAVSYGWPDDAWDSIDCGVVRLVQDRLALIPDSPSWNQRAVEMIHAILRLEEGLRGKATNAQIALAWLRFMPGISLVRKISPVPDRKAMRTPMIGALVRYHEQHPEQAVAFAKQYDQPLVDAPSTPAQLLLAWMCSGQFVGCGYRGQQEVYWRSVYAMAAHRDKRSIDRVVMAASWDGKAAPAAEATDAR